MRMTLTFTADDGTLLTCKTVDVQDHKKGIEVAHDVLSSSETLKEMNGAAYWYGYTTNV